MLKSIKLTAFDSLFSSGGLFCLAPDSRHEYYFLVIVVDAPFSMRSVSG
jgi:hypothetical protein